MMVWVSHFANFFSFIVGRCFVSSLKGYCGIVLTFFILCEELPITYYMHLYQSSIYPGKKESGYALTKGTYHYLSPGEIGGFGAKQGEI